MSAYQSLAQLLQKNGRSLTSARRTVYDILSKNEPVTMSELVKQCSTSIDRASVYRTIALFEELGLVQRLQIGWKYKLELSNAFQAHHHHLSCARCGSVVVLAEDDSLEQRLLQLATPFGYESLDHQIEIKGICPACQKHYK